MPNLPRRKSYSPIELIQGIQSGNRTLLSRAITLAESSLPHHQIQAREVLQALLPTSGQSLRLGITGAPGAGKSTLIEALGLKLLEKGHKLAVLAIDPSSQLSQGSILGDKTRMEALSRHENCYIRPSPASGHLGGVGRHTREAMLLCEAAGYDIVLVETVGVGQSEYLVRSMVDFFLLLLLPGAGDELQGIKKGVMEMVDAVLVNKADGENRLRAQASAQEYRLALKYLTPATEGWKVPVLLTSALEKTGLEQFWQVVENFKTETKQKGLWEKRRSHQLLEWFEQALIEELKTRFFQTPSVQTLLPELKSQISQGQRLVSDAVEKLLNHWQKPEESTGG